MSENQKKIGARQQFLQRFSDVAENSPWVAEEVWERYPADAKSGDFESLVDAFARIIRTTSHEKRIELLSAHPDLACGVVASSELSKESRSEQEGAGLDRCNLEEFIEFQSLNIAYRKEFGFPFIIAVRGMKRREILESFRRRIERTKEQELATAVENVIRIVGYRIAKVLSGHG
jgi:OHCU decarboxylase